MSGDNYINSLVAAVNSAKDEIVLLLEKLASVPSDSNHPGCDEDLVQREFADYLWQAGMEASILDVSRGSFLERHPAYRKDRILENCHNISGLLTGGGGGKNLCLCGHLDTLSPDSGELPEKKYFHEESEQVVGVGVNGGKGALAAALIAVNCIGRIGLKLKGDLLIVSTVDEVELGLQGLLSFTANGIAADAALYLASPGLFLATSGTGGNAPGDTEELVEAWECKDSTLLGISRELAVKTGLGIEQIICKPECGAFLINNYADTPTLVAGQPMESRFNPNSNVIAKGDLKDYACMIGSIIIEYCEVV